MHAVVIPLDGDSWTMREALGETAEWYVGAPLPEAGNNVAEASAAIAAAPGWIPASVPGAVIDDLAAAGEVPDPRVARNSRASEWVAERSWVYRRAVVLAEASETSGLLEFDGIDPGGEIYWDGERVGEVAGLYHRVRIRLSREQLAAGRHALTVRVRPAPVSEPQVGRTDRVRVHTPRLGYGWDFSPRMRHQGIWKPARLRMGDSLLGAVVVRTDADGRVAVEWTIEGEPRGLVTVSVHPVGSVEPLARTTVDASAGAAVVAIEQPALWWPNTMGEPHRYDVRVVLETDGVTDEVRRTVGFRSAELIANPGAPADALPYTAIVNGVRVPLIGWNWTPADTLFGSIRDETVEHLLGLAADSGARLIRVWGGGLVESEHFYDTCDRLGLLVWQEFSQSSSGIQSAPSRDPEFVALMRSEAERLIPERVHHPSLLVWGGGNELDEGGVPLDDARSPVLAALSGAVRALDPGRGWLPTSPTGPEFHHRLDRIHANPDGQHDVHGPWEHQGLVGQYTLGNAGTNLAHTEFGVEGMTNRRSLDALIPVESQWPADRSNPVYRHLGEWWNNARHVIDLFDGRLQDVASLNRASQLLQATGLQYSVEADLRRAPRCSMVLPWQLNESYPNAWCTAAIDYLGDPKPAYFAVQRAFEPTRVTLKVDRAVWGVEAVASIEAWVWAELGVDAGSIVTVRARSLDGSELASTTAELDTVGDPSPAARLELAVGELPEVFVWEAEWATDGQVLDLERAIATTSSSFGALLDAPATTLTATARDASITIRNDGPVAAITARIVDPRQAGAPGRLIAAGDPRPLMPGESRTLGARWSAGASGPVVVESWNAREVEVLLG